MNSGEMSLSVQLAITMIVLTMLLATTVAVYAVGITIKDSLATTTDEVVNVATDTFPDVEALLIADRPIPLATVYRVVMANEARVLNTTGHFYNADFTATNTVTNMSTTHYTSKFHTRVTVSGTIDANEAYTLVVREVR